MNQSKEVPDLVVFMKAAIKAIDELPAQAMRATGGCEKCGMAMIM